MKFDNDKPIYKQLVEQLKIAIVNNEYKLGEKIPSVRDYALMLKVNPNTISKALVELEENQLIITKRTNGKFVTENKDIIKKIKHELACESINKFIMDMENLNISRKEAINLIKGE